MRPQETAAVARLWHDAWHRAHAAFVPPELVALRSLDEFHLRLRALGDDLRLAGPIGAPLGLCVVRGDELDQIYVTEPAQGTGLAQALLRDGEARIAGRGRFIPAADGLRTGLKSPFSTRRTGKAGRVSLARLRLSQASGGVAAHRPRPPAPHPARRNLA